MEKRKYANLYDYSAILVFKFTALHLYIRVQYMYYYYYYITNIYIVGQLGEIQAIVESHSTHVNCVLLWMQAIFVSQTIAEAERMPRQMGWWGSGTLGRDETKAIGVMLSLHLINISSKHDMYLHVHVCAEHRRAPSTRIIIIISYNKWHIYIVCIALTGCICAFMNSNRPPHMNMHVYKHIAVFCLCTLEGGQIELRISFIFLSKMTFFQCVL